MSSLDELAPRIIAAHHDIIANERSIEAHQGALRKRRREAGMDLIKAKAIINHGEWISWLRHIGLAHSTAKDYMNCAKDILPEISKKPKTARASAIPNIENATKRKSTLAGLRGKNLEQVQKVRDALKEHPEKLNSVIIKETGSSWDTVKRERENLVKERAIKFIPARAHDTKPWSPPDKDLTKTIENVEMILAYMSELFEKMSPKTEAALLNPKNVDEQTARDGFLDSIRKIRKVVEILEDKFAGKAILRVVRD